MRARILMATMHIYASGTKDNPAIDDVIKEAGVSRGTFYKYFDSLDLAFLAVGQEISDQFALDLLPIYDILKEPWQRFAVGFRLPLLRASIDPQWASFVTRTEVWPRSSIVARKMVADLQLGLDAGVFQVDDVELAADFLKGACLSCIQTLRRGVSDPSAYMDAAVSMGLSALGCDAKLILKGVSFSARHLEDWRPKDSWINAGIA